MSDNYLVKYAGKGSGPKRRYPPGFKKVCVFVAEKVKLERGWANGKTKTFWIKEGDINQVIEDAEALVAKYVR